MSTTGTMFMPSAMVAAAASRVSRRCNDTLPSYSCSLWLGAPALRRQAGGEGVERPVDLVVAHPAQVPDADDPPAQGALAAGEHRPIVVLGRPQQGRGVDPIGEEDGRHARRVVLRVGQQTEAKPPHP